MVGTLRFAHPTASRFGEVEGTILSSE